MALDQDLALAGRGALDLAERENRGCTVPLLDDRFQGNRAFPIGMR